MTTLNLTPSETAHWVLRGSSLIEVVYDPSQAVNLNIRMAVTDPLDFGDYVPIDPGITITAPTGNVFASGDLDVIVIPMATAILTLRNLGTEPSVFNLPQGYWASSVSGSSDGQYLLVVTSGVDAPIPVNGFYASDDAGASWTFYDTLPDDYGPYHASLDDGGAIIYSVGGEGDGGPRTAYTEGGFSGIASGVAEASWSGILTQITRSGSDVFVAIDGSFPGPYDPGIYRDPLDAFEPLLLDGDLFCIDYYGGRLLARAPIPSTTYSMDGGATWFDGPVASVGSTSALAIAGSGARMGVLDDSTGGLWLTGIMEPDPIGSLVLTPESGRLIFTGNALGVNEMNPIAGHLTLLGNIPTVLQLKLNSPIEERRYVYHVVFTLTGVNLDFIDTITVDEVDDLPVHIIRKDATAILCSLPIELTPGDWTINSVDIYGNHYLATLPIIEDILPVQYP